MYTYRQLGTVNGCFNLLYNCTTTTTTTTTTAWTSSSSAHVVSPVENLSVSLSGLVLGHTF